MNSKELWETRKRALDANTTCMQAEAGDSTFVLAVGNLVYEVIMGTFKIAPNAPEHPCSSIHNKIYQLKRYVDKLEVVFLALMNEELE
jgi:hypothetical protein